MKLLEKVVLLVSKLPPDALTLLVGLVDSLLSAKSPEEAKAKLASAALAAGYKQAAKLAWRETVKRSPKL